jgi:exonuclease III
MFQDPGSKFLFYLSVLVVCLFVVAGGACSEGGNKEDRAARYVSVVKLSQQEQLPNNNRRGGAAGAEFVQLEDGRWQNNTEDAADNDAWVLGIPFGDEKVGICVTGGIKMMVSGMLVTNRSKVWWFWLGMRSAIVLVAGGKVLGSLIVNLMWGSLRGVWDGIGEANRYRCLATFLKIQRGWHKSEEQKWRMKKWRRELRRWEREVQERKNQTEEIERKREEKKVRRGKELKRMTWQEWGWGLVIVGLTAVIVAVIIGLVIEAAVIVCEGEKGRAVESGVVKVDWSPVRRSWERETEAGKAGWEQECAWEPRRAERRKTKFDWEAKSRKVTMGVGKEGKEGGIRGLEKKLEWEGGWGVWQTQTGRKKGRRNRRKGRRKERRKREEAGLESEGEEESGGCWVRKESLDWGRIVLIVAGITVLGLSEGVMGVRSTGGRGEELLKSSIPKFITLIPFGIFHFLGRRERRRNKVVKLSRKVKVRDVKAKRGTKREKKKALQARIVRLMEGQEGWKWQLDTDRFAEEVGMRVITLNLNGVAGRSASGTEKLRKLKELLRKLKPHIVLLQETHLVSEDKREAKFKREMEDMGFEVALASRTMAELRKKYRENEMARIRRQVVGEKIQRALFELILEDKYEASEGLAMLISSAITGNNKTKYWEEERTQVMRITLPGESQKVYFLNVYGFNDPAENRRQLEGIARKIKEKKWKGRFVLGGDFNNLAFPALDAGSGRTGKEEDGLNRDFEGLAEVGFEVFRRFWPRERVATWRRKKEGKGWESSRIDSFWAAKDFPLKVLQCNVLEEWILSDHLPVLLQLKIPRKLEKVERERVKRKGFRMDRETQKVREDINKEILKGIEGKKEEWEEMEDLTEAMESLDKIIVEAIDKVCEKKENKEKERPDKRRILDRAADLLHFGQHIKRFSEEIVEGKKEFTSKQKGKIEKFVKKSGTIVEKVTVVPKVVDDDWLVELDEILKEIGEFMGKVRKEIPQSYQLPRGVCADQQQDALYRMLRRWGKGKRNTIQPSYVMDPETKKLEGEEEGYWRATIRHFEKVFKREERKEGVEKVWFSEDFGHLKEKSKGGDNGAGAGRNNKAAEEE